MSKTISAKLRKFLDKQKGVPLSNKDVVDLVDRKADVVLYEDLHTFESLDELFGDKEAVFLMVQQSPNWGHWVALLKNKKTKTIEFFDPLGVYPDDQLAWTKPKMRKQLHMDKPYLTMLLEEVPDDWKLVYNKTPFQKDQKKVNTCGRFTALRIMMRHFDLKEFTDYFKERKGAAVNPDDVATMLTVMELDEN